MTVRRIALEVVTAEQSQAFRFGRPAQRAPHAPALRGACIVAERSGRATFFALEDYAGLWKELRRADEVITWNGNHVALLVLRRLYGAKYFPIERGHVSLAWGRHIDLCALIESERRLTHRISLAKAVKYTFGEEVRARPSGRSRKLAPDERIQRANTSAGRIMRLWRAYRSGDGLSLQGGPTLFHPDNAQKY